MRERNPISTRGELFTFGTVGLFWFGENSPYLTQGLVLTQNKQVLGVFMAASESQTADVECFSNASSTSPLDDDESNCQCHYPRTRFRPCSYIRSSHGAISCDVQGIDGFCAAECHNRCEGHC
jgi:hypothetical protein